MKLSKDEIEFLIEMKDDPDWIISAIAKRILEENNDIE
jgi:hypothetical protein